MFEGEGSSLVRSGQFPHLRCDTDFGGLAVDCAVVVVVVVFVFSPRIPQWQSAGLVIGRSRVRSPAGAARFFFFVFFFFFSLPPLSRVNCTDTYFGIRDICNSQTEHLG